MLKPLLDDFKQFSEQAHFYTSAIKRHLAYGAG